MEGSLSSSFIMGNLPPVSQFRATSWSTLPNVHEHPLFYVGVYAAIGITAALASTTSTVTQYTGALRASRLLFKQLLIKVMHATMRWHDVTPQGQSSNDFKSSPEAYYSANPGRMLNRFGKDIETIDSSLAGSLQAVNSSLANFLSSIIIIT